MDASSFPGDCTRFLSLLDYLNSNSSLEAWVLVCMLVSEGALSQRHYMTKTQEPFSLALWSFGGRLDGFT